MKRCGSLSFAENIGAHATKAAKYMSNKYSEKIFDSSQKSAINTIKTASKLVIQNTEEAAGDLIGNKTADKITIISKSPKEFHSRNASKELHSKADENEIQIPRERYIFPEKEQQIIYELRLV